MPPWLCKPATSSVICYDHDLVVVLRVTLWALMLETVFEHSELVATWAELTSRAGCLSGQGTVTVSPAVRCQQSSCDSTKLLYWVKTHSQNLVHAKFHNIMPALWLLFIRTYVRTHGQRHSLSWISLVTMTTINLGCHKPRNTEGSIRLLVIYLESMKLAVLLVAVVCVLQTGRVTCTFNECDHGSR